LERTIKAVKSEYGIQEVSGYIPLIFYQKSGHLTTT